MKVKNNLNGKLNRLKMGMRRRKFKLEKIQLQKELKYIRRKTWRLAKP
tara:strand:+ start:577 stop:720 length:144 start_codon:yes stop_codon:yes gene_type:complete